MSVSYVFVIFSIDGGWKTYFGPSTFGVRVEIHQQWETQEQ